MKDTRSRIVRTEEVAKQHAAIADKDRLTQEANTHHTRRSVPCVCGMQNEEEVSQEQQKDTSKRNIRHKRNKHMQK